MRIRYFSFLALALAGAFVVVASQAFALVAIQGVSLGVNIGILVASSLVTVGYRNHLPSSVVGSLTAIISGWTIVASQVFSLGVVQALTFAGAVAVVALAIVGLTAHELSTERVVHSLEMPSDERHSMSTAA
jgi:NADH:ubiquinone oxidoreductase subunit 6 (subunit J)